MKLIPVSITQKASRAILKAKKNSPHIFFAAGVTGVVASTVMACRATLKLEQTLDEVKEDFDNVRGLNESAREQENLTGAEHPYTNEVYIRDLGFVYGKAAGKFIRLYGPSFTVGAISIAALTGSHIQMARRNTALTVTLAAVSKAYEEYRVRVQEEIGVERELDIYRDIQERDISEDGKKKELVKSPNSGGFSPYARLFEESNVNWRNNAEFNLMFIKCQQVYANDKLQTRGHIFLNEIYDCLGMERTQEGQVVGWVINGDGDNYISFGLEESPEFLEGREKNVWLDFNVDGVVFDKI